MQKSKIKYKICGIIGSKTISRRFPFKNRLLFENNLNILIDVLGREHVYMFSDDIEILSYCLLNKIAIIPKGPNFSDEHSHLDIIKFCINYIVDKKYNIIVSPLCNTIGHTPEDIENAINALINDPEAREVKAFDKSGHQTGLFAFWAESLPMVRHRVSAITCDAMEIHYRSELDFWKKNHE